MVLTPKQNGADLSIEKILGMVHADGNSITLQPAEPRSIAWKIDGDDVVIIACIIPWHYEGGMVKKVPLSR